MRATPATRSRASAPKGVATKRAATKPAAPKRATTQRAASPTAPSPVASRPAKKQPTAPATASAAAKSGTKPDTKSGTRHKLVRDSFTMPTHDFSLIHTLKERTLALRRPTKKSELLRAGLHALAALSDTRLRAVLEDLTPLKAGRPKKNG